MACLSQCPLPGSRGRHLDRALRKEGAAITTTPFKTFSRVDKLAIATAMEGYGNYLGMTAKAVPSDN